MFVAMKMKLAALHGALLVVALTIHQADADAEVFLKSNSITWTKDFVVADAGRERREVKGDGQEMKGEGRERGEVKGDGQEMKGERRERREAKSSMTADEIREVIDHHNALRAAEGAANMELMVRD